MRIRLRNDRRRVGTLHWGVAQRRYIIVMGGESYPMAAEDFTNIELCLGGEWVTTTCAEMAILKRIDYEGVVDSSDWGRRNEMLLAHLLSGRPITFAQAWELYGCHHLLTRWKELRSRGHNIVKEYIDTPAGRKIQLRYEY